MITVLKGSPQYSIDNNGLMTVVTTWLVMPDSTESNIVGWYAFENEVTKWAGNVGDNYKMPKGTDGVRDIYHYTETDAFIVSDVQYACVEGRTHYEVTFTNEQNVKVMRMENNVSAQISNSNERTKSVTYIIDVLSDNPLAIDSHFLESGTSVTWAGSSYKISESSYDAQSKTRYSISITAQDMAVMKVGNTQFSTDNLGQKTASATWRYSTEAYNEWVQPVEGEDASPYLGLPEKSGYLVSSVSAEPNGVLGYTITISADHVSKRHITTSYREYEQNNTTHKSSTIRYQSDKDSLQDFDSIVSDYASAFGRDGERITEVSISETGRNNFDVNITTTDDVSNGDNTSQDPKDMKSVPISMSLSEYVLDAAQCGYMTGLSGELHPINDPPKTKFSYPTTPDSLIHQSADSGGGFTITADKLLQSIKNGDAIGFDRVIGVQAEVGNDLVWLGATEIAKLTSLKSVKSLKMEGFVYAQPTMTVRGTVLRSLIFDPWDHTEQCPITFAKWEQIDGRDKALPKSYIGYKIRVCEFSVDIAYKGNVTTLLRKNIGTYYENAIKHIQSPTFTSYKGGAFSMNEVLDGEGKQWTRVTCAIHALLKSNKGSPIWNHKYDQSYVLTV